MNLTIELPITKDFHLNSRIKHKLRIKSSSSKSILEARRWTPLTNMCHHLSYTLLDYMLKISVNEHLE